LQLFTGNGYVSYEWKFLEWDVNGKLVMFFS
jgi:hypothetical protein